MAATSVIEGEGRATSMMSRRKVAAAIGMAIAGHPVRLFGQQRLPLIEKIDELAAHLHARMGVMIIDLGTGQSFERNADQLFPITSTFKAFAAAAVLARVERGQDRLDRRIRFSTESIVTYSPITEARAGDGGMSLEEVCEAACTMSDNTAGNLLLQAIGGPSEFTRFMRSIGDGVTRLDRIETALNEGLSGDARDTTSPRAALTSLDKLLLRDILSDASRDMLRRWMVGNKVAGPLLRSGVPSDWIIADRSGAGGNGSRAIIAAMWRASRQPILAAIYITETPAPMNDRNAAIAQIGAAIAATFAN